MAELDRFEARFATAYRRYLDEAPVEVDARAVVRRAAAASRGQAWAAGLRPFGLSPALAWALILAGLLLALAVGSLVTGGWRPDHVVVVVPSPIPPASAVPTASPSLVWARVADEEGVFGGLGQQSIASVATGGPGLVAVGSDGSTDDECGAVWTSVDGTSWARVPHDEAVFGGPGDQRMKSVAAVEPGLIAVGFDHSPENTAYDADGAMWVSEDGSSWARVPHDEAVFGGPGEVSINSVTAGGPGLVAVGSVLGTDGITDGLVWVSADGYTWTRVRDDEGVFGGPGHQGLNIVIAGGPGLVALGEEGGVWGSDDGLTWSHVLQGQVAVGGGITSVTRGGPGFVAVGYGGDVSTGHDAAVWVSANGYQWTRVHHNTAILGGPGHQFMNSVAAGGQGLIAVGSDSSGGSNDGVAWVSADGSTWTRLRDDEAALGGAGEQIINSVVAWGPGFVAVGLDAPYHSAIDGIVWVSPPGSP